VIQSESEIRDGMQIDWDAPIEMDDGVVMRADIFRPLEDSKFPAILSYGPYGKWFHFGDYFVDQWTRMCDEHPDVPGGSTNKYQSFEVADPEKFVPDGYAVIRVDSRGTGRSPGFLDPWSAREAKDLCICIEWAGEQPWCNGKVGLNGISYLAMNQWQVAALQPSHLAAMCVWEGAADYYRDMCRHGGIFSTFSKVWYDPFVVVLQNGLGTQGFRSSMTGGWVSGPETLPEEKLRSNRRDWHMDCGNHVLASDEFWTSRLPDFSKIKTPLLSAANWGGQGLHLRGNVEGFLESASEQKWLEFHGREHWTEFYTDYGVNLQKKFFGYFLKGEDTGWGSQPRVQMQVRHPEGKFLKRSENEWPLARTQWTRFYLDPVNCTLSPEPIREDADITYRGFSDGVSFITSPLTNETEITGPIAAKLFVSSSTEDVDLFVVVRVFAPDFREVTFQGHTDPHTTIAQGWLRASHRKLDMERSLEYRPYHTHDEIQVLTPGEIYELDIEVWPTCIVVPEGHRIALSVRGKDYAYPGGVGGPGVRQLGTFTGVGPFRHNELRPARVFDGKVTLHCGPVCSAHVLLPIIPPK
jgi:predicted acyl esterase